MRAGAGRRRLVGKLTELPVLYVVLSLVIGTFLVFAQPPGQGLDEIRHFYRVWTIASGAFTTHTSTGTVTQCVSEYMNRFANEASKSGPFSFSEFWQSPNPCLATPTSGVYGTAAFNGPVSYLPAVIAVAVLRGVGAPVPLIFFGGRLAMLGAFVALYYTAIRVIPTGKRVLFVLGLLPTTLLLASTYSADPMTIAFAVLAISLTLRARRHGADLRAFLAVFLVLAALALTKPTLFVLAPLLFLVPSPGFGRARRHPVLLQVVAAIIVVALAGLWSLPTSGIKIAGFGLNPHKQILLIVHDPFGYLWVLTRTFFESMGEARWLPQFVFSIGFPRPLVPDSIVAPVGLVIVASVTLWYAYQLQFGERRHHLSEHVVLVWLPIALAVAGVLLVETTLFVYGTPVGFPVTQAQGRYFYPFVPLPLITIDFYWRRRDVSHSTRWIMLGSAVMLVWLVVKIFVHDYNL